MKGSYTHDGFKAGLAFASIGQGAISKVDQSVFALTTSYEFGRYSIGGGFQQEFDIQGISGNDRNSLSLGGTAKVGEKGKVKLQFANTKGEGEASDATLISVGYDYALDASTTIYIAYANVSNDTNVNFSTNGKGHGDKVIPSLGDDPHAISLGIIYNFEINLSKHLFHEM